MYPTCTQNCTQSDPETTVQEDNRYNRYNNPQKYTSTRAHAISQHPSSQRESVVLREIVPGVPDPDSETN